jgi:hypothetical protein
MLGQVGRHPCRDGLETADMQRLFEMICDLAASTNPTADEGFLGTFSLLA